MRWFRSVSEAVKTNRLRVLLAIVTAAVLGVTVLHFLWAGFNYQLGTVGEWLTAGALGLAGYELWKNVEEQRRSKRTWRANSLIEVNRRWQETETHIHTALEDLKRLARKEEGRPGHPGQIKQEWDKAMLPALRSAEAMRFQAASILPVLGMSIDTLTKSLRCPELPKVEHEMKNLDLTFRDHFGSEISPRLHSIRNQLTDELDEIRGLVMFEP